MSQIAQAQATAVVSRVAIPKARTRILVSDLNQLYKTRVSLMVVITAWAGFYLGSIYSHISSINLGLLQVLVGVALVSCGASALNEAVERSSDARMRRTANRPLASRRMSLPVGIALGLLPVIAGAFFLARFTNLLTVALALITVFSYVAIYTPLKRHTTLATFIGAFPGAMPPLLGWTAARGRIEWPGVVLFAILFIWQFPHFMAIAWLYREDYARAGIKMLPVVEPDGKSTVLEALLYAILLIPVSLAPVYLHAAGYIYGITALALGIFYLWYTIRFARITRLPNGAAHDLLRVSVIYLPLLLAALMLNAKAGT
jgi:protoheme IX farnesyltransferase